MNKRVTRRLVLVVIGIGVLAASVGVAFAGTLTTPSSNPFTVPSDGNGNPVPFDIVGKSFPVSTKIYAMECDGTPANAAGWTVGANCDTGSAKTPEASDASGNVTFPASDPNHHFPVFKGDSPQQRFWCLSLHDPIVLAPGFHNGQDDPALDGQKDWDNCQLRVASGLTDFSPDQTFLTLVLPDTPSGTTSTTTTTSSTSTTSSTTTTTKTTTTTTTSTTTTTAKAGSNPSCGMGAGIPQVAPKPPKNSGLVKISKGLLDTPAVKDTKWKFSGTLDNCMNFPMAVKTGTPITSGSMKASVELPPGSTCSSIVSGPPVKAALQVKWNALSAGKSKPVAADKFKAIATFTRVGSGTPIDIHITTAPIVDPKSMFIGHSLSLDVVIDENQASLDAACHNSNLKGITLLHFTGGGSSIQVLP
jgi:hypothetical protein